MKLLTIAITIFVCINISSQQVKSPELLANRQIIFRFASPKAKEVKLRLESRGILSMTQDGKGIWTITVDSLEPDIYTYNFIVDGLNIVDPSNSNLKYNLLYNESQVCLTSSGALHWEINDVPHGTVHRHFYKSGIIGDNRDFYVYTPPQYNPESKQEYPVLYLLHGYSDDATAWVNVGRANYILDNLIAQRKAKPMIIVMPLGYGNWDIIKNGWQGLRDTSVWDNSLNKYGESLLKEIIPMVEKNYHAIKDKNSRAIAGLSMGGSQSLLFGLNNPNTFGWIGAFSSGGLRVPFECRFPELNKDINTQLHLLWIACGKQDGLIGINQQLINWLKAKGITLVWTETEGEHSFRVWRKYLAEFTPLLFK